ncbi:hypothetical protein C7Q93_01805 [Staphylococcus aureus]|nr:hypothetical protein BZP34_11950 [Staphylococcus aureus]AUN01214.1 hypothetical protein A7U44_04080 [Staphylococcus aureus]AXG01934.1 hypothetical protein DU470_13360 [Staphylococcus aureus]AXG04648.1 hypothetical protein DU471_13315 [Staphylococcus aureus]MBD6784714.1 hypothetical protein [Staphylococcus aureus]
MLPIFFVKCSIVKTSISLSPLLLNNLNLKILYIKLILSHSKCYKNTDLKNFNNIKHKYEYEYFCSMQMALLHLLKCAICYE